MAPTNASTKSMKDDTLAFQVHRMSRALNAAFRGRERQWTESLDEALAGVEGSLRRHMMTAQQPEGVFAEVDETRPTLARQAARLREEHGRLLEQCVALRGELRQAPGEYAFAAPAALPTPGSTRRLSEIIPGNVEVRRHAEQFYDELRLNLQAETGLVLESISTDIGVCD
jgi:hypothetical protein